LHEQASPRETLNDTTTGARLFEQTATRPTE
jgi:hypothetical protein